MKVLFIRLFDSYFDRTVPAGMRRLGWEVDEEVFFTPTDQTADDRLTEMVRSRLRGKASRWDFCFTVNFWPVLAPVLDDLGLCYVSWSYDAPLNFTGTPEMERENNYIFLFDRGQVRNYQKQGISRVWHLPLATDPRIFDREIKKSGFRFGGCGVSFLGSFYYSPYPSLLEGASDHLRGYLDGVLTAQKNLTGCYFLPELITEEMADQINAALLSRRGKSEVAHIMAGMVTKQKLVYSMATRITCMDRLTLLLMASRITEVCVFTGNDPKEIGTVLRDAQIHPPIDYDTEMPVVFSKSRINLCPTLRCIETGIPLRAIDIMACHGVLMMPVSEEAIEYLESGVDCLLYSSYEEAADLMGYYLKHDDQLDHIREKAYEKVRREFSMEGRLVEMEEIVRKRG